MTRQAQLEKARDSSALIRFARAQIESGTGTGYVVDVGPEFVLLLIVDDGARFNGFEAIRIADISDLSDPDPHAEFVEEALRLRGEQVSESPPVAVESLTALLMSAGLAFPVVTIHREDVDSEVCHIGHVVSVSEGHVKLLQIDPDADWDDEPTDYRLSEITRVDFGGAYEEALVLVGGSPPLVRHLRPVS